jgi:hypothetical protein
MTHHAQETTRPDNRSDDGEAHFDFSPEVTQRCDRVVERYKIGELSKPNAVIELQRAIPRDGDDSNRFDQAFGSYFRIIDTYDGFRQGAASRTLSNVTLDRDRVEHRDPVQTTNEPAVASLTHKRHRTSDSEEDECHD